MDLPQSGVNRQNYNLGALNAGEHTYTIFPTLTKQRMWCTSLREALFTRL